MLNLAFGITLLFQQPLNSGNRSRKRHVDVILRMQIDLLLLKRLAVIEHPG
ncbi:hypothetical protein D3C80_1991870 [compost metagenome]